MKSITEIAKQAILAIHPGATSSADNTEGNSHKMIAHAIALYESELFASIIAESKTVSQHTQAYIDQSFVGAKNDRREFAQECASQYGFKIIDEEGVFYGVTGQRLSDLMSAIGYRCPGEKRHFHLLAGEVARPVGNCTVIGLGEDVSHIMEIIGDPDPEPKKFREKRGAVHDPLDKLMYAFAHDAAAAKHGARLFDLDSFKKLRQAFEKQRMKASIRVDASALMQTLDEALDKLNELKGGSTRDGGEQVDMAGQDGIDLLQPRAGGRQRLVRVNPGYDGLASILVEALNQAQQGKGHERHNMGGGIPFERQRMQTVSELIGSVHGMTYQVCKKVTEGVELPTIERQVAEMLGAINYLAGIIIFLRKQDSLKRAVSVTIINREGDDLTATAKKMQTNESFGRHHGGPVKKFDPAAAHSILKAGEQIMRGFIGQPPGFDDIFGGDPSAEPSQAASSVIKLQPNGLPYGVEPNDRVRVALKNSAMSGPFRAADVDWHDVFTWEEYPEPTPVGGEAWGGPGAVIKSESIGKSTACSGCPGCASGDSDRDDAYKPLAYLDEKTGHLKPNPDADDNGVAHHSV